jgi:hypothetical protein
MASLFVYRLPSTEKHHQQRQDDARQNRRREGKVKREIATTERHVPGQATNGKTQRHEETRARDQ